MPHDDDYIHPHKKGYPKLSCYRPRIEYYREFQYKSITARVEATWSKTEAGGSVS